MKWITILFIMFLIQIVIIANLGLGLTFFPFIYKIPGGDKIGHFFLMGILSYLVNYVLKSKRIKVGSINFLLGNVIVMAVVTIEEISQIFLEYRAFSLVDLLFDYLGIFLFGYLAVYFQNSRQGRETEDG